MRYHDVRMILRHKQVPENCQERLSIMLGHTGRHGKGQPAVDRHAYKLN